MPVNLGSRRVRFASFFFGNMDDKADYMSAASYTMRFASYAAAAVGEHLGHAYPYGLIVTRVRTGTSFDNATTSSLYMRMQPSDTMWPIEDGSFVP